MLFRDVPWAKCSLCNSCKDKAAKADFKIQPVTLPTPSFTDLILFTTGTMRSQWADSERTLNVHWTYMQWTRHRTLRKLRERANRWKSKENLIFVFFLKITINCTDLLLFAAFWTVFNVCSMLRSLYVHCMFNVSFHQKLNLTRDDTPVTLSDPTYPMLSRHTTYLDTPDWPGLFPSYLSLCAGAWSMVACSEWVCWMWMWPAGRKQKEMLFRDGWWTKSCTST